MPNLVPVTTPLPRLDVPAKRGPWAWWQRLKSKAGRREAFSRTMNREDVDDDERLARLRALVDMGLWGDHTSETGRGGFHEERRSMGYDVLRGQRSGLCTEEVLHLALEAGVDPNWHEQNHYDDSLLTLFARHNMPECMALVLKAGANPRWRDTCEKTALHIVLQHATMDDDIKANMLPMAEHLLGHGVDINDHGETRHNDPGAPPIQVAIEKWDVALVQWLLDRGATLDGNDQYGDTPFHWAATANTGWSARQCEPMLELLRDHGAPLDAPNRRGETPAWLAMKWRNADVGGWLLAQGANPQTVPHTYQDSQGYEFPNKPAASLLQVFCENIPLTPETEAVIPIITAAGEHVWQTLTPDGVPLHQALREAQNPWMAFVEAGLLEQSVEPAAVSTPRRGLRL